MKITRFRTLSIQIPQNGGERQQRQTVLLMDQLQTMITGSIQAALPSLEDAIATKVTQSLQAQGKRSMQLAV